MGKPHSEVADDGVRNPRRDTVEVNPHNEENVDHHSGGESGDLVNDTNRRLHQRDLELIGTVELGHVTTPASWLSLSEEDLRNLSQGSLDAQHRNSQYKLSAFAPAEYSPDERLPDQGGPLDYIDHVLNSQYASEGHLARVLSGELQYSNQPKYTPEGIAALQKLDRGEELDADEINALNEYLGKEQAVILAVRKRQGKELTERQEQILAEVRREHHEQLEAELAIHQLKVHVVTNNVDTILRMDDQEKIIQLARESGIDPKSRDFSALIRGAFEGGILDGTEEDSRFRAAEALKRILLGQQLNGCNAVECIDIEALYNQQKDPGASDLRTKLGEIEQDEAILTGFHARLPELMQQVRDTTGKLQEMNDTSMKVGVGVGIGVGAWTGFRQMRAFWHARNNIKQTIDRLGQQIEGMKDDREKLIKKTQGLKGEQQKYQNQYDTAHTAFEAWRRRQPKLLQSRRAIEGRISQFEQGLAAAAPGQPGASPAAYANLQQWIGTERQRLAEFDRHTSARKKAGGLLKQTKERIQSVKSERRDLLQKLKKVGRQRDQTLDRMRHFKRSDLNQRNPDGTRKGRLARTVDRIDAFGKGTGRVLDTGGQVIGYGSKALLNGAIAGGMTTEITRQTLRRQNETLFLELEGSLSGLTPEQMKLIFQGTSEGVTLKQTIVADFALPRLREMVNSTVRPTVLDVSSAKMTERAETVAQVLNQHATGLHDFDSLADDEKVERIYATQQLLHEHFHALDANKRQELIQAINVYQQQRYVDPNTNQPVVAGYPLTFEEMLPYSLGLSGNDLRAEMVNLEKGFDAREVGQRLLTELKAIDSFTGGAPVTEEDKQVAQEMIDHYTRGLSQAQVDNVLGEYDTASSENIGSLRDRLEGLYRGDEHQKLSDILSGNQISRSRTPWIDEAVLQQLIRDAGTLSFDTVLSEYAPQVDVRFRGPTQSVSYQQMLWLPKERDALLDNISKIPSSSLRLALDEYQAQNQAGGERYLRNRLGQNTYDDLQKAKRFEFNFWFEAAWVNSVYEKTSGTEDEKIDAAARKLAEIEGPQGSAEPQKIDLFRAIGQERYSGVFGRVVQQRLRYP